MESKMSWACRCRVHRSDPRVICGVQRNLALACSIVLSPVPLKHKIPSMSPIPSLLSTYEGSASITLFLFWPFLASSSRLVFSHLLSFSFPFLSFPFIFSFLLFPFLSFLSFLLLSYLCFFFPSDLRLTCVCAVIGATCNIYICTW